LSNAVTILTEKVEKSSNALMISTEKVSYFSRNFPEMSDFFDVKGMGIRSKGLEVRSEESEVRSQNLVTDY